MSNNQSPPETFPVITIGVWILAISAAGMFLWQASSISWNVLKANWELWICPPLVLLGPLYQLGRALSEQSLLNEQQALKNKLAVAQGLEGAAENIVNRVMSSVLNENGLIKYRRTIDRIADEALIERDKTKKALSESQALVAHLEQQIINLRQQHESDLKERDGAYKKLDSINKRLSNKLNKPKATQARAK